MKKTNDWIPTEKQKLALVRDEFEILFGGARGGGKLLSTKELIPTPDGFKLNGELKDGDEVFGQDGRVYLVEKAHPVVTEKAYKISFDDGTFTFAHDKHLWLTFTHKERVSLHRKTEEFRKKRRENRKSRGNGKDEKHWATGEKKHLQGLNIKTTTTGTVKTTQEILNTLYSPAEKRTKSPNHSILLALPAQMPYRELPIDPYVLGAWLGDGTSDSGGITGIDYEIFEEIEKAGYEVTHSTKDTQAHYIRGLVGTLREIGVLSNKHIPSEYVFSSYEQRLSLLQGLMDTDGSIMKDGQSEFCNKNEKIADAVYCLVASLGAKPYWSEKESFCYNSKDGKKNCGIVYLVKWTSNLPCFRLQRKLARLPKSLRATQKWRYITNIEIAGDMEMRCITTSNTEGLYLFGKNFNVTHNTSCGMAWLLYDKDNPLYKALVIRKNAQDLSDWVSRARIMYAPTGAEVVGNPPTVRFPSGAFIKTGHLNNEDAYEKYQGHEYQKINVEELTQIPSELSYLKLLSSCRSTVPGIKPQIFASANPGGAGHKWVKKRFSLNGIPTEPVVTPDASGGRPRVFVPSKIDDNPHLMNNDPGYVSFLDGLPDGLRQQWRDGSWDDFDVKGAVYGNEINQARKEKRITKVPHELGFPVHTWWDIGVGDYTAVGFYQFIGKERRMIDYYQNNGYGIPHYVQMLKDREKNNGYIYGTHNFPHDIEVREFGSGKSRRETLEGYGITTNVVRRLSIEDGINAGRVVFPSTWFDEVKCAEFLDAVHQYRYEYDETRQIYKNTPFHDWTSHASDLHRYFAIGSSDFMQQPVDRRSSEFAGREPQNDVRFHYE